MIAWASATITGTLALVNDPVPLADSGTSPVVRVVETSTLPVAPVAPGWMCAAVIVLVDGNPVIDTSKIADAEVTLLDESRPRLNVMLAVPAAVASGPVV